MPDDSGYRNALAQREQLRQQLQKVEEFLRLWEELFLPEEERVVTHELGRLGGEFPPRKRSASPSEIAEAAEKIIGQGNQPMTRGDLAEALESAGLVIDAKDKSKNVGTIMWRFRDRFVNIPGHGYWLRGRPYDRAGYRPESSNID